MKVWLKSLRVGVLSVATVLAAPSMAQSMNGSSGQGQVAGDRDERAAFGYEERSTLETIPFASLEDDSMADTVIEGGLQAPAAGVPIRAAETSNEDFFLDPLALQPGDSRTDMGRTEVPAEIKFRNPRSVPGQNFTNNYIIRPVQNRSYEAQRANVLVR